MSIHPDHWSGCARQTARETPPNAAHWGRALMAEPCGTRSRLRVNQWCCAAHSPRSPHGASAAAAMCEIVAVLPRYEANLNAMIEGIAAQFDLEAHTLWTSIRAVTLDRIDLQALALATLGGFTSLGATVFLVILYAGFLLSERGSFPLKIAAAMTNEASAAKTQRAVTEINRQIGLYLAVKTLINMILVVLSYAVLWALDVDFALFWAITNALLNCILYVGSYIGVAFPVILSLGQFASLQTTLILLGLLVALQAYIGNSLEPHWIGRQLNMSPFVVLVALSVWGALWSVPGAIPMTSILIIVTSSFEATRFVGILLSERVKSEPPAVIRNDET